MIFFLVIVVGLDLDLVEGHQVVAFVVEAWILGVELDLVQGNYTNSELILYVMNKIINQYQRKLLTLEAFHYDLEDMVEDHRADLNGIALII